MQFSEKRYKIELLNINIEKNYEIFDSENIGLNENFILFCTPLSFLRFFRNKYSNDENYIGLVIDEPEYCLSFGYEKDLKEI